MPHLSVTETNFFLSVTLYMYILCNTTVAAGRGYAEDCFVQCQVLCESVRSLLNFGSALASLREC